jgi:pimeloyl-ACP methyl ester carboxylesterase
VSAFLQTHSLKDATLIGHSMGAKTVMTMALADPSCCANIVAVDNAPVDAALASDFPRYVEGMRKTEEAKPMSQKEADALMEPYAKELPVRQFLLTNLVREPGKPLKWRVPVKILADALDDMADFPYKNPDEARFSKRALFIRGTKSHYVSDETLPIIGRFFPRFELADIEAGHWVISEKPEDFINSEFSSSSLNMYCQLTPDSGCGVSPRHRVDALDTTPNTVPRFKIDTSFPRDSFVL